MITAEQLENKVAGLNTLPTLPSVVQRISRMADDRTSSAADVAGVISADQVLCSKLLRVVNSPAYGFPGRISSVKHALVLLGFNVVKGLVLGSAIFGQIGRDQGKGLWEHSLGCAILSRRISKATGLPDAEEVMIAGLLHDLGKVVMQYLAPHEYGEALVLAERRRCPIAEAEREILGADHACVAGWIAQEWCFPARLAEPLAFHHRPELAKAGRDATCVVHLADILSRALGYGFPGDRTLPLLDHQAYQSLGLSFPQLDTIVEETENEFAACAAVLDMGD